MNNMPFLIFLFISNLIFAETEPVKEPIWLVDFTEAKNMASSEGKYILMSFQGSDWCNNCRRLEKSLFQDSAFLEFADENLILLKLDFPMKKENRLTKEQTSKNEALAEKYNSEGAFPKLILFDANGTIVSEEIYPQSETSDYLTRLKKLIYEN